MHRDSERGALMEGLDLELAVDRLPLIRESALGVRLNLYRGPDSADPSFSYSDSVMVLGYCGSTDIAIVRGHNPVIAPKLSRHQRDMIVITYPRADIGSICGNFI
jgi:hypothetical protein